IRAQGAAVLVVLITGQGCISESSAIASACMNTTFEYGQCRLLRFWNTSHHFEWARDLCLVRWTCATSFHRGRSIKVHEECVLKLSRQYCRENFQVSFGSGTPSILVDTE